MKVYSRSSRINIPQVINKLFINTFGIQKNQCRFKMNYMLIKEVIDLICDFETSSDSSRYKKNIEGFKDWIAVSHSVAGLEEPQWEAKEKGRSAESVINTLLVHLNRYARTYSKAAMYGSNFSTQEEFIYLINLKAFGAMSKMELIKKNIQDKPVGMQIINRLIKQEWVVQTDSHTDKRSKLIEITPKGSEALEAQMAQIRKATKMVTGNLTEHEKMELIRLLTKLDHFHKPIFMKNHNPEDLLRETGSHL